MIVFTAAVMDLLHRGHLNLLKEMSKRGAVIVFLHDNRSTFLNKGIHLAQSYYERERALKETGYVFCIIKVETQNPKPYFEKFIKGKKKEDLLYMRGDDWQDAPGLDYLREQGIKIEFVKYTKGISSTKLRKCL